MTRRLLLGYLAITLLVLLILEVPLGLVYGQREQERLITGAESDALVLASYYEDVLEHGAVADPEAARAYAARTGARVIVVDAAGISVLDTSADPGRDFSTRPEVATALAGSRSSGIRSSDTLGHDLLYVAVPVASGGVVHGVLRLTIDAHEVAERIQRFWLGLGLVALVVLAAATAVGWAVARSVTRPLRALQESAARFAGGDLRPVDIGRDSVPEVVELGGALNTMAGRLDELLGAQRAFVGDASHQLRTPLTALRLRLENLEVGLDDPERRGEVTAAVDEIERLSALVDDLLRLARAERPAPAGPVDVAGVARDRVDTWSAAAAEVGVEIELVGPDTAPALAVPGAVEQILDNTIDNAVAVAPPGSTVTVTVAAVGGPAARSPIGSAGATGHAGATGSAGSAGDGPEVTLSVADRGPGLDDERKARAVERFWRGDGSRPGSGLGLAIATRLVEAGGGRLTLDDVEPTGLRVTAHFAPAPPA